MNMKRLQGASHKCVLDHSDRNSPCCRICKFQKAGTRCQEAISATCKGTSSCTGKLPLQVKLSHFIDRCQTMKNNELTDISSSSMLGNSSHCPPPSNAKDNTTCVDNGRCHNGECNPFCEATQNLRSCACNGKKRDVWCRFFP